MHCAQNSGKEKSISPSSTWKAFQGVGSEKLCLDVQSEVIFPCLVSELAEHVKICMNYFCMVNEEKWRIIHVLLIETVHHKCLVGGIPILNLQLKHPVTTEKLRIKWNQALSSRKWCEGNSVQVCFGCCPGSRLGILRPLRCAFPCRRSFFKNFKSSSNSECRGSPYIT